MEKRSIRNLIIFDSVLVLSICAYKIAKNTKKKVIKRNYTNIGFNEEREESSVRTYTKLKRND